MNNSALSTRLVLEPNDSQRLARLCGKFDEHLRHIESRLGVRIKNRGNQFQFEGIGDAANLASALVHKLYQETISDELTPEALHLHLQQAGAAQNPTASEAKQQEPIAALPESIHGIQTRRKFIRPRGLNQISYIDAIRSNDINFGVGPAGTGKTWLAVAAAVEALENHRVERILLVRPAVEAGEKLGFLPGDLTQKIDPYLRPLYDALYEMMGVDQVTRKMEKNIIEVAPLAFMRGRTLNNSFIILDESQNTTREQMKMFLTRIGFGSTAVITGDDTQIDLPQRSQSGLLHVKRVLRDINGITFTQFNSRDVVRHPLVQRIVEAYAEHMEKNGEENSGNNANNHRTGKATGSVSNTQPGKPAANES
ncbi:MAG: PhoH family protein [Pseudomonadales bacterium]|nr:PhoH family protein [Gammaproteobacteria bacterium]NNL56565.1 PhoH family protein [Pseudomonadales bacterium]